MSDQKKICQTQLKLFLQGFVMWLFVLHSSPLWRWLDGMYQSVLPSFSHGIAFLQSDRETIWAQSRNSWRSAKTFHQSLQPQQPFAQHLSKKYPFVLGGMLEQLVGTFLCRLHRPLP